MSISRCLHNNPRLLKQAPNFEFHHSYHLGGRRTQFKDVLEVSLHRLTSSQTPENPGPCWPSQRRYWEKENQIFLSGAWRSPMLYLPYYFPPAPAVVTSELKWQKCILQTKGLSSSLILPMDFETFTEINDDTFASKLVVHLTEG